MFATFGSFTFNLHRDKPQIVGDAGAHYSG